MGRSDNLYPAFRKALLDYLSKMAKTSVIGSMTRAEAAALFNVSIVAAGTYLRLLALQFKDSLRYYRGLLVIVTPITDEQIAQVLASENSIPYPESPRELPKRKRAKGRRDPGS